MRSPKHAASAAMTAVLLLSALPAAAASPHVASLSARDGDANPGAKGTASKGPAGSPGAAGATDASDGPMAYDKFVKDAKVSDGLFSVITKGDKVYLGIAKDQIGKEFYEHATTANGLGGYGILSGDDFAQPARIVRFERANDKTVALVLPQIRFSARPNTAAEAAIKSSTAESTMALAPVAAEDKASGKVAIDTSFLLGDTLDLGNALSELVENPKNPQGAYHEDRDRSYFGPVKAFPKNVLIEAEQTYASAKPDKIDTVTDPHSILMRVKYNFAEILSTPGYLPRLADDRVGYWQDPHVSFDRDDRYDNIERYALRWSLRASDPSKPSKAVKPLVYTLTNTIPASYRPAIQEAILEWNKAFERIGILNAVQVQDQPTDPNWDPDDIRYNTIRWLTEANGGGFAEAQIEWDPRTGEIFRGGVLIDSDMMRYGKFEYGELVAPVSGARASAADDANEAASQPPPELWDPADIDRLSAARRRHGFIHRDGGAKLQAAFGALALDLMGEEVPAAYAHDFLKAVVMHEVGHDFGLAHNFIGHNSYTAPQLKSKAFTSRYGVASSVMEYAPINLWPKNSPHGDFYQVVLGPYDYHVIRWGYTPIPGAQSPEDETPTLNRWSQAAVDPKYAFASDEDVDYGGHAVDPRVAQWMLTNDAIGWCETQLGIDRGLLRTIDARYPRPQMPWDQERFAFSLLLGQYGRCAGAMTHYVAGEYLSRARRGDPGAPLPLTPVSRDEEYRAFRNLDRYLFADSSWRVSPQTLRRLTYSEYESFGDFGYDPAPRHDLSLSAAVARYQNRALANMFAPLVLERLTDLPSKAALHQTMSMEDLFSWTQASVYGDLASGPSHTTVIHRNLQRSYARLLERIAVAPVPGTPYDAQALARHELASLAGTLRRSLRRPGLDLQTRAHLEALGNEVKQTLDTRTVTNVPS